MRAPTTSRRVSAGIGPGDGATSRLPAWWGADDWLDDVRQVVKHERRDVCRDHHVEPDTVVSVARGMAAFADHRSGRDCRPTNARLCELLQVSLSTVQRARRVLKACGFVVELVRGRSIMTRAERLQAWRRGSSHRQVAAVFALCSRRARGPKVRRSQPGITAVCRRGGGAAPASA
ncbi:MAG: helix-turn-helix domain-containing protein, partial [Actinomycetes bacterium]